MASAINKLAKNRTAWMLYAQSLERENTTLKERVAELEKSQSIILAYCEVSIAALKGSEGDQSEYDGMYQAVSDLLEKIKGEMPWPDLVLDRVNQ